MLATPPVRARRRVDLESITCPIPTPPRRQKLPPRPSDYPPVGGRDLMNLLYASSPRLARLLRKAERGRRIRPAEVLAAYAVRGVVPCDHRGRTWDGHQFRRHANAKPVFDVLYFDDERIGKPVRPGSGLKRPDGWRVDAFDLATLEFGHPYASGFLNAWDLELDAESWEVLGERVTVWHPAYALGHDDGTAARKAVCRRVREF